MGLFALWAQLAGPATRKEHSKASPSPCVAAQILTPAFFRPARRLEKVDIRSLRSVAKIAGTAICLAGAAFMAFFKGPGLLGAALLSATSDSDKDWVKGGIYLVGNAICVSIWYILQVQQLMILRWQDHSWQDSFDTSSLWLRVDEWFQVPVCKSYLDPLSLATWMCFLATLQCAAMALFLEPNYLEIWKLTSFWEFPCILYGVSSPGSLVRRLHIATLV